MGRDIACKYIVLDEFSGTYDRVYVKKKDGNYIFGFQSKLVR